MSSQSLPEMLSAAATRLANRALDRLLGIRSKAVLNADSGEQALEDPAQQMRQLAQQMRACALDKETGQLDYAGLAKSDAYARFKRFAGALPACRIGDLGDRAERIAFWVNLYNALILHGVIRQQVKTSILSDLGFFRRIAYNVGRMRFSADDIEHGVLRGNARHPYLPFRQFAADDPRLMVTIEDPDPRIHFALVCGAQSCPPFAAYDAPRLDAQLEQAAAAFIGGAGARYVAERQQLWLSRIFKWYAADFGGRRAVRRLVANHLPQASGLERAELKYLPYDWSLNGRLNVLGKS